jgi:hypothetical protein
MKRSLEEIGNECVYIEDELGIVLVNLSGMELAILARVAAELAELSDNQREEIFDELAYRLNHEGPLYDDDQGHSLE